MKILILGGDGYLGWPTAMFFSKQGHDIRILDNFIKKKIENEENVKPLFPQITLGERVDLWNKNVNKPIDFVVGDLLNHRLLYDVLESFKPDTIIHYAEQPSAPYSMKGRDACYFTQHNNVLGTINLLFGMKKHCPDAHLIKLGTMGEYGTPNIDIEEGWLEITHKGRKDRVLYPKKPMSFYHLSKVHDSNNIEFACRVWGTKCTDLNQGCVYGLETEESKMDEKMSTSFHYDQVFGTVINRFICQSIIGKDLTVYGNGTQTRGYLNIIDTLNCVNIATNNPASTGEFRVFNQYTEVLSINDIAKNIISAASQIGIKSKIKNLENPRTEQEDHYYKPNNESLIKLGLKPIKIGDNVLPNMMKKALQYKDRILEQTILPTIKWKQ
jgi:UDP-sulfoquinovose synthase